MKKVLVSSVLFVLVFCIMSPLAFGQVFDNLHRIAFPQIVYGSGWVTTIVATNISNSGAQVTYGFGNQDGTNLYAPIVRRSGELILTPGYNPGEIPPKGSWTNVLQSAEPTVTVGAMSAIVSVVDGKDTVKVQVTYSYQPNGVVEGQAAVFPVEPSKNFGFQAVRANQNSDIGVAICNFNYVPANVRLLVHNMAGQIVASVSISIPPGGQVAKFITELAPELKANWSGGLIEVSSDQLIAVMSIPMSGSTFSSGTTF